MLTRLEELRILYRLLGKAQGMQMANPRLVTVWHHVTSLLFKHLLALHFLLQSRFLPDHRVSESCLVYPCTALQTWCQQAKSDQGRNLLVDIVLVEAALGDTADPRTPLPEGYQPPSIYLIGGLEHWTPLHIYATIFHEYPLVKRKLKHLSSGFDLSTEVQNFVQDIWHLNHGKYEERVESRLQVQQQACAELRPLMGALWAPAVRLLTQCQPPLALRCLDCLQVAYATEQINLQLDLLLANCRVIDTLEEVRRHCHLSNLQQLLGCVKTMAKNLKVWEAREQMELFLQAPLPAAEEEQLVSCFCELVDPTWMRHVLQHFRQTGRPHAAFPLNGCLQELFREVRAQQSNLPEVRRKVFETQALVPSFMMSMSPPASQLKATARKQNQFGAPVQYPETVPTRVPLKGTTPRLPTQVTSARVTLYVAEASKPPARPSAPDKVAESESYASMFTPTVGHCTPRSLLEKDVGSILCTPSVILWHSHHRVTTSATQQSKSILSFNLKRRPVELPPVVATPVLPRGSEEKHAGACLTRTELGEDVQLIPADPSDRRLRFSISDSNSS
ncbi:hypothetical protein V5799_012490 [Amblyomma americanum]|uniref:ELYS-like domain-containing protein n=1 Tax=Amblyomma americanum TaxID=6943 RepID=A0AAQ4EDV8_AMBAM